MVSRSEFDGNVVVSRVTVVNVFVVSRVAVVLGMRTVNPMMSVHVVQLTVLCTIVFLNPHLMVSTVIIGSFHINAKGFLQSCFVCRVSICRIRHYHRICVPCFWPQA